jgi:3-oxoacyl-[acyl-carrier protein] reductase
MEKVVLVTGASKGIGAAIAVRFAMGGYKVVINYNSDKEGALKTLEEVSKYSEGIIVKCDITNDIEINNMFNEIIDKYGRLDVLVNNAGIAIDTTFDDKTRENFIKTLDTNLVGPFMLSKLVGNYMRDNKSGSIINISSTNGIDTYYPYSLDYDASKAGLISLTHNLASYYAPYVRVNAVCPGWVDTPMNKSLSNEFKEEEINKTLLHIFADPSEIASLAYFLSSDKASYINDSIIKIDGGRKC